METGMKDRRIIIRVTDEMAQQLEAASKTLHMSGGDRRHKRGGKPSVSAVVHEALTAYLRRARKRGNSSN